MIRSVGKYTFGHDRVSIRYDSADLIIGAFCSIGCGVTIYLGGNHRVDWATTYPFGHINQDAFPHHGTGHPSTNGNVTIGNDVWIADNVTIMSGCRIGDGAIIANGSHVVCDIPPYSVFGGNPAKLIKQRFDNDTIKKLLAMKWWDWDDNKIRENLHLLCSSDLTR